MVCIWDDSDEPLKSVSLACVETGRLVNKHVSRGLLSVNRTNLRLSLRRHGDGVGE